MIANHFGRLTSGGSERYPRTFNMQLEKVQEMRYGENPHQSAAFYKETRQARWVSAPRSSFRAKRFLQQRGRYRRRARVR